MTRCDCLSHNGFLTAKGLEETEQRRGDTFEFDGVDRRQLSLYLDRPGSVSGSPPPDLHWPDDVCLNEQARRSSHGS